MSKLIQRKSIKKWVNVLLGLTLVVGGMGIMSGCSNKDTTANTKESLELLNVSYDPTRELYTKVIMKN